MEKKKDKHFPRYSTRVEDKIFQIKGKKMNVITIEMKGAKPNVEKQR